MTATVTRARCRTDDATEAQRHREALGRVYKVGGPALEDPGCLAPLAAELRRAGGPVVARARRRAPHRAVLERCGIESQLRGGPARDVGRGHGGGGDGPLGHASTRAWPPASPRRACPRWASRGATAGLIRARLEPGLGRVGTPGAGGRDARSAPSGTRASCPWSPPSRRARRASRVNVNADEAALGIARALRRAAPRLSLRRRRRAGGGGDRGAAHPRRRRSSGSPTAPSPGGMVLKVRVALAASAAGIPEVVVAGKARLDGRLRGHGHPDGGRSGAPRRCSE